MGVISIAVESFNILENSSEVDSDLSCNLTRVIPHSSPKSSQILVNFNNAIFILDS